MRLGTAVAAFGLLAGIAGACDGNETPEVARPPDGSAGSSGSGGASGSGGSGGADASPTDAPDDVVLPEASSIPVRVGVLPSPAASGDAGPGIADETLAHLDVVAAGARAVTIERRWDALFEGAAQPDAAAWQYLAGIAEVYRDAGRSLLLSLSIVDRALDARPAGVTGAWDAVATKTAAHALVDRSFLTFGEELAYLSFGTEVDRFLSQASPGERAAFVGLVEDSIAYARQHPSAPQGLKLGVTLTADALVAGGSEVASLLSASDVAIVTYHAVDGGFQARPASSAAGDLDALWSAVGGEAGSPQIVLQEVAYPSAEELGGSLDKQRTFFDGLFLALLSRRERFPFVVVRGLNEQRFEECEADAQAVDAPASPAAIAAFCSFGLRDAAGAAKPAWASVVDGLATFSSP